MFLAKQFSLPPRCKVWAALQRNFQINYSKMEDFDNDIMPDFSGARRVAMTFLVFCAFMALLCMLTCGSTAAINYM